MSKSDKSQEQIASSRFGRAGKLVGTGAKVGANYMKHYAKSLVNRKENNRNDLDESNAKLVYEAFSELKGGPLKMAQMLSMGEQILPKAYTMQFAQAQNKVTPLSYPLIRKTFKAETGAYPEEIFDSFSRNAVNAASIGQVHLGEKDGEKYAIKIQYPGVADSLKSDLRLITPMAARIFGFSRKEIDPYVAEVESKLLEETNYKQELAQGQEIISKCQHIDGLAFPKFEPNWSGAKVLCMSWIEGKSLSDWLATDPSQEMRNEIGQRLWDFYQYQIHELRLMHADPHPGNFLVTPDAKLGIIDFGCVKSLPDDFYASYNRLMMHGEDVSGSSFIDSLYELDLLLPADDDSAKMLITEVFGEMFQLVGKPFFTETFDFGDDGFFKSIYEQGERLSKDQKLRGISARGSKHFIYFNRTFFGLYQLLNQIKANVQTRKTLEAIF